MKKKTLLKGLGITAAAVTVGGVGFVFAAPIAAAVGAAGLLGAASTGTAISTLFGAALTNASLAAIGGGALGTSATAFGVSGGIAAITGASAATGAGIGVTASKIIDKIS